MSLSVDQGVLEKLQSLSTFFDFVSDPKKYQTILQDVKTTLQTMEATIKAHTTVQEAAGFLAQAQARALDSKALEQTVREELAEKQAAWEVTRQTVEAELAADAQAAKGKLAELARREQDLEKEKLEQARLTAQLKAQQADLNAQQEALTAQMTELAETRAKVAKLLGA